MIEQPAGRLLTMCLDRLYADYLAAIDRAAQAEKHDMGLPAVAQFDPDRRVWLVPTVELAALEAAVDPAPIEASDGESR